MNPAHLHLLLNHIPVLGVLLGVVLFVYSLLKRNDTVMKTAFFILLISALLALPVYFTGEPAEEVVDNMPGVTEAVIEQHENTALISFIGVEILGVLSIAGLLIKNNTGKLKYLNYGMLVIMLLVGAAMAQTANTGGQIRHTEIRNDAGNLDTNKKENNNIEKDEDD